MTLLKYRSKRDFEKTREPKGGKPDKGSTLRFVVQKHAATRLHYDVRLEYKGILLSWAVPKGPSMDPNDKRLAIHVEDHPLEYQYFEGVIPKGNYGAGTVEIWDAGTYTPVGNMKEGLAKGHFAVIFHGEKLHGEFIFQKFQDKNWLMIKKEDTFAREEDPPPRSKKMPSFFSPMLATLVDKPFDDEEWLFEIKWDGFRALAFIEKKKVELFSRTEHSLNARFKSVVEELETLKGSFIFDGELVILDKSGRADFQLMQNYQRDKKGSLFYYVFDLLYKDGQDLREVPLIERKKLLEDLLKNAKLSYVRYSGHIIGDGKNFFKEVSRLNLEGIIGKKIASTYQSRRSRDWVKIKHILSQEVVIGGFTQPKGSRKDMGALLVGVYNEKKELEYAGHVGGGFTEALLADVRKRLKPQAKCPFKTTPKGNTQVTWVKPLLVAEVKFSEWTSDRIMRQPIFLGLRDDKPPVAIKKELPEPLPPTEKKKIHQVTLTNLDKVFWPEEKYTKGDLLEYYKQVSSYILPYLKDRPIVLHRYPEGIEGQEFYHKDLSIKPPAGIRTFPLKHGTKTDHYLLIDDLDGLLYAVNLGSIDLHPFLSRIDHLENPDFCVIDLDPHDISFDKVVEVAWALHELLDKVDVPHFVKTSGGKGLHILIPFWGNYSYEQSQQFALLIAFHLHKKFPKSTSVERNPQKRPKKIYLDCLQNSKGQTIVAPYSVRPRPHALVSAPLEWKEVNEKLDPKLFNIKTMPKRLKKKGDLLHPILSEQIDLAHTLKLLEKEIV